MIHFLLSIATSYLIQFIVSGILIVGFIVYLIVVYFILQKENALEREEQERKFAREQGGDKFDTSKYSEEADTAPKQNEIPKEPYFVPKKMEFFRVEPRTEIPKKPYAVFEQNGFSGFGDDIRTEFYSEVDTASKQENFVDEAPTHADFSREADVVPEQEDFVEVEEVEVIDLAELSKDADDVKQYFINTVQNLLSYEKRKEQRISWSYDIFDYGNAKIARMRVIGKNISIYLSLNLNEFMKSKYQTKEVSGKLRYESVPLFVKIKSSRGVKYAQRLVDTLALELNLIGNHLSVDGE